jgi:hypothetical protein
MFSRRAHLVVSWPQRRTKSAFTKRTIFSPEMAGMDLKTMAQSEIAAIRALPVSKPRPVGWIERRQRLDEVGAVWPVADDVKLVPVDAGGVAGEWSSVPDSDASRVLLFFHGGG